jgi:hypothetical protein
MTRGASTNLVPRRQAWAHGRAVRDGLLRRYCAEYGLREPPTPVDVVDELLTDFLGAELHFDPLPLDRFAQTVVQDGHAVVTVNSLTYRIPDVRDVRQVLGLTKWHELIHVVDHVDILKTTDQPHLPGFDLPQHITCPRARNTQPDPEARRREFWAEEAGRAAAVSLVALTKSGFYQRFQQRAATNPTSIPEARELLTQAAQDIGVEVNDLLLQLEYEGRIVVVRENGLVQIRAPWSFLPELGGMQ